MRCAAALSSRNIDIDNTYIQLPISQRPPAVIKLNFTLLYRAPINNNITITNHPTIIKSSIEK
jgi:hypothetical protein